MFSVLCQCVYYLYITTLLYTCSVEKIKEAQEDERFPDQIDTPLDIPARKRFSKYSFYLLSVPLNTVLVAMLINAVVFVSCWFSYCIVISDTAVWRTSERRNGTPAKASPMSTRASSSSRTSGARVSACLRKQRVLQPLLSARRAALRGARAPDQQAAVPRWRSSRPPRPSPATISAFTWRAYRVVISVSSG